jgi:N-methylhydantoinase A
LLSVRVGIDVGGTFTDFFVVEEGRESSQYKVLSTPADPSIGLVQGLSEIAVSRGTSLADFARRIDAIVHGTTVTTNAVLTRGGARTGLLTTSGVRDALEMRRGVREEQYNNRYTNVPPLVPRRLRAPVRGRRDYKGDAIEPLNEDDVREALRLFASEGVEAVAICFMNSFASAEDERRAARIVEEELPSAYVTVSSELLPSIRFYNRVSTTVLNSYVGPKLDSYLRSLQARLKEVGFGGVLLVMQSTGGVVAPEVARKKASLTLLSGPAAGPRAGLDCARVHGRESCITIDMGGTSFDASLVRDGAPEVVTEGDIGRYRIALPMLGIVTIGAGGGSIGWVDEGGLLRMGPSSAGSDPGPACYGRGGKLPACTDADLVLGYLDPDYFAGGRIRLLRDESLRAIEAKVAKPLGLDVEEAAAGMARVIDSNMAQGVREVTVKRGFDPREFPMVVAGGAGPLHACAIARELEMPLLLVPRDSSIFCAAGMLMTDLQHDFVRSFVSRFSDLSWPELHALAERMVEQGRALLAEERVSEDRMAFQLFLDCRYAKQYHEVSFPASRDDLREGRVSEIARAFHAEHNRMYGYSLEDSDTPIELINVRLRALGRTDKPARVEEARGGEDPSETLKGERRAYVPEAGRFEKVPIYDGHRLRHGHRIAGPALVEQVNTTLFLSRDFDCVTDRCGSFAVYPKAANAGER